MTQKHKTWLKVVGGFLFAYFALTVIASEGTVIDQTTGRPITGAFVVAYWIGNTGMVVQTHSSCYHAEYTMTDEKGRFSVSMLTGGFNPLRNDRTRNISVFVPGYETTFKTNREKLAFMMAPREGTKSEQFKAVLNRYGYESCPRATNGLPFFKAWQKELAALAVTREELERASGALWSIDEIEFGQKIADKNRVERRENQVSKGQK